MHQTPRHDHEPPAARTEQPDEERATSAEQEHRMPSISTKDLAALAGADLLDPPDPDMIRRIVKHEADELDRRRREFNARNPEATR